MTELVRAYYERPGNSAGGNCHIVLDDGNLDDASIRSCLEACVARGDVLGARIMLMMLKQTGTQRRLIGRRG